MFLSLHNLNIDINLTIDKDPVKMLILTIITCTYAHLKDYSEQSKDKAINEEEDKNRQFL